MTEGRRIRVRGQVQGVGFRPFVWHLAQRMGLSGDVANDAEGVLIHVAGDALDAFERALVREAPALSRIDAVQSAPHAFAGVVAGFAILASRGAGADTGVVPDAATCPDCLAEISDPGQRRFGYAFTNCTSCGPRFSILTSLPFDRSRTTMAPFPMCPDCAAEYADPRDRRFHAQAIACPACGPKLWLEQAGQAVPGDPIAQAAERLRAGGILAIKGLGGFHLACDAANPAAVGRLRRRKRRPAKPFALMGTMAMVADHAVISPAEAAALASPAAPIVLLAPRGAGLAEGIAPGLARLGWMLPYTPLHHLVLAAFGGPLVMTSGNASGAPQVTGNREALETLAPFADAFLMHDRDIARRLDDTVLVVAPGGPMVMRRGRGLAPGTTALPPGFEQAPQIVAYGGQTKAALCLIKDGRALVSQHLGDLDNPAAWAEYLRSEADLAALFGHQPTQAACDLHPGYRASQHAAGRGLPFVQVQHHHAHLASCLADNLWPLEGGPVAGIVLDGLGLGTDGTLWGGEVLLGGYRDFRRVAGLVPAPLLGGDRASVEPSRNLLVRLEQAGLGGLMEGLFPGLPLAALRQIPWAGPFAPMSSSMGRLFDAFAAALGLGPGVQSHDGEAAMRLESLALEWSAPAPSYPMGSGPQIDPAPLFQAWANDRVAGAPAALMAARFHAGIAEVFADQARRLVQTGEARAVALSGGCFQNALLLRLTLQALSDVPVLVHRTCPANDGGLALGQALVAAARALCAQPSASRVDQDH